VVAAEVIDVSFILSSFHVYRITARDTDLSLQGANSLITPTISAIARAAMASARMAPMSGKTEAYDVSSHESREDLSHGEVTDRIDGSRRKGQCHKQQVANSDVGHPPHIVHYAITLSLL